ncbi:hypothetical protein JYU34_006034 [Plutella xylostella]|uniref:Uncharacterized protein n=1 Tax=Plutella xylostella TaxID=51655 RepID=A0ABQ7QUT2_PLUXY|nr:hypothetical protein JYU34_006034 [Plutella xylostella]
MSDTEVEGEAEEAQGAPGERKSHVRLMAPDPEPNQPTEDSKVHMKSSQKDIVPDNVDTAKVTDITNTGQSETTEQKSSMSAVKEEEVKQLANTLATNIWTKQSAPTLADDAKDIKCALKDKKMPIPSAPQLNHLSGTTSYPIKPVISLPAKRIETIPDSKEEHEQSKTELNKDTDENVIEMPEVQAEPTTTREITEWADEAGASGAPRGEGRTSRAVRRFFCCGAVDAASEDNVTYTRTGSGI